MDGKLYPTESRGYNYLIITQSQLNHVGKSSLW